MRILQIIYSVSDECGGPAISVKNLARALAFNGHKVSVSATKQGIKQMQELPMDGYTIYEFPAQKPYRYFYSPKLGAFLKEAVKKYDLVHIHGIWSYPTFIAAKLCLLNKVPYIIRTCGMLDSWGISQKRIRKTIYFHAIEKRNLEMASFIQFSTEVEFKRSFYKKRDRADIKYIANILDVEGINNNDFQPDRRLIDKKYILFFGRLCYKKGLDVLIEAFSHLPKDPFYKDIYLVLMGPDNDNYLERLKRKMPDYRAWDKIINLGIIYGARRFGIVKGALFACLPSRQENIGLSIIETLACGVPVLVSGSMDMANLIEKNCAGRISNINCIGLCSIMKEMIDSDKERIEMGQNGKKFVYEKFNKESILQQHINMYEEAVKGKSER